MGDLRHWGLTHNATRMAVRPSFNLLASKSNADAPSSCCRPFFAEINALIFLAPISCFDERLTESPSTNRLEDSFLLWGAICSSALLKHATFIVFLNKVDLLEEKLARGVQVYKYLPSYGERKNEVPVLVRCALCLSLFRMGDMLMVLLDLKGKFRDMASQHWPQRILYVYATAAVVCLSPSPSNILSIDHVLNAGYESDCSDA